MWDCLVLLSLMPELRSGKIIKSSTPTVEDFMAVYRSLLDEQGFECIYSIHLSSLLSGTINAAVSASRQFPEGSIKIIDTKKAAIAEGFVVIEIAKAVDAGADEEKVDKLAVMLVDSISFYATFENFGFETGDFTGWDQTIPPGGSAHVVQSHYTDWPN